MSTTALNLLNFFLADVRDGLGPFLGVYLQQKNWDPAQIGLVGTIGGIAGMLFTTPLGVLIDVIKSKRSVIIFSSLIITLACILNYYFHSFVSTTVAQIFTAIAGASIPPAISSITLGLVGQKQFDHQLGRNESFNHAGNAFSAIAAGVLSYKFGLAAVFVLMGVWTVLSIITVLFINPNKIDYKASRGMSNKEKPESLLSLLKNHAMIILGVTVSLFHLANAAMLPLLSQSMVDAGETDNPGAYTSLTIVVAQITMVPIALLAAKFVKDKGFKLIFVIALSVLPLRGIIAALYPHFLILFPVQILDGVGAGLMGVAVPGLVARILNGTGRFNAGLGLIMTIQGVGASLSSSLGGVIAKIYGYNYAFIGLAIVATIALVFWLIFSPRMSSYRFN